VLDWVRSRWRPSPQPIPGRDVFAEGVFPVGVATHDLGLTRLFDLATVLMVLGCRPGDRVLDLGAGSGFSSEMLARFGYDAIAVDPDIQSLRHNRRRPSFDAARIAGRVRVAASLAQELPFDRSSFDGIIGLNVLHHVPDLTRTIQELARVLRPGRRAVFCEPGLRHLEMQETKRAIAEHGENDRPFDVLAFLRTARTEGFAHALLPATLHTPLRLVPVEEVDLFASGQHPHPQLTERGVLRELHEHHAFALLIREGEREKTSRLPGLLRADVHVLDVPQVMTRERPYSVRALIRNTGDTRWMWAPSPMGGYVTVGCKLALPTGRVVRDDIGRTLLPADVAAGGEVTVDVKLVVPSSIAPGSYRLHFDLVDELICWFSDLPHNTPQSFDVVVG
jgi:SAM-dependent methyltransferase